MCNLCLSPQSAAVVRACPRTSEVIPLLTEYGPVPGQSSENLDYAAGAQEEFKKGRYLVSCQIVEITYYETWTILALSLLNSFCFIWATLNEKPLFFEVHLDAQAMTP